MSWNEVSPSDFVLNCSNGELLPTNSFECQPIWLEMLQQTAELSHQWAVFTMPLSATSSTVVLLRSSSEPISRRSKAMEAFLLSWEGEEAESLALQAVNLSESLDAQDAVTLWTSNLLLLITSRLRDGQCASVMMLEPDVNFTMVELQHLWKKFDVLWKESFVIVFGTVRTVTVTDFARNYVSKMWTQTSANKKDLFVSPQFSPILPVVLPPSKSPTSTTRGNCHWRNCLENWKSLAPPIPCWWLLACWVEGQLGLLAIAAWPRPHVF